MGDSDFVLVRSEQTADEAPYGSFGSIRWVASGDLGSRGLTVGRVVIRPGESNPRHAHSCEEVLLLLSGKIEHTAGDESVTMGPGDAITIPAGVFHNARSLGPEDAVMVVAFSSAQRDFIPEEVSSE